jgi:hypothetical protein
VSDNAGRGIAVTPAIYHQFDELRETDAAFEAAKAGFKREIIRLFELPEDLFEGPSDQRMPQQYGDYKVVYRSRAGVPADPGYAERTYLWPTAPSWRRACAWRRRREI